MEREVERLKDDVATLKAAIEAAISKGQKSVDGLNYVHWSGPVSSKKSVPTRTRACAGIVSWLDDF